MSTEHIWETFDSLFKTVHRQGRRVEELEARIAQLERRLHERSGSSNNNSASVLQPVKAETAAEMPAERAA